MDKEQLFDSLLTWVQTIPTAVKAVGATDLSDGVVMAEILTQIAPSFFDASWNSKIKTEIHGNWRLKVSNLKKILKGILDYYAQVLGLQILDFHLPDVNLIGEHGDRSELSRLLQLILGCAVNCEHKQEYIQHIMGMEESVQHVIMNTIQELMTKEAPGPTTRPDNDEQVKKCQDELSKLSEEKEELIQRCHDLDQQVEVLQIEKASLVSENETLTSKLNQGDGLDDPSTPAGRRFHQLSVKLEQVQEECYRYEASRDDFRIRVELQEKEILELQQRCDDVSKLAEEVPLLKDEVDVLRNSSEKVDEYEATILLYKKKLEEHGDMRRQLKLLEDKNTEYVQRSMDQEEELRKVGTLRNQVDMYKRQVQEQHLKLGEETKRADKSDFERKRAEEKLAAVVNERDRLQEERNQLKEANEDLKLSLVQKESEGRPSDTSPSSTITGVDILDMMPPEIKERYLKLQHENKLLHSSQDERSSLLQTSVDELTARVQEMETENRLANHRILELEGQLEDVSDRESRVSVGEDSEMRRQLQERSSELMRVSGEVGRSKVHIEELQGKLAASESRLSELEDELHKKEDEIESMTVKYKRYLEQAKAVICALDPRHNPRGHPEVQALRQQLQERDRRIGLLERDAEKARTLHDQEKELVMGAWYNLSNQLHRQSTEERLSHLRSPLAGQSFLARQRQVSRRVPSNTLSTTTITTTTTTTSTTTPASQHNTDHPPVNSSDFLEY